MAGGWAVPDTDGMTAPTSTAVIRQWARDNGLPVGDRGRLSPELLTAYAGSRPTKPSAAAPKLSASASASARASRRDASGAVRVPIQPTPGATGIAHKIVARAN